MIIGLVGKKETGKSTVAKYLIKKYLFTELAFATELKEMCIRNGLMTHNEAYVKKTERSRWAMQKVGELFRKEVDKYYWIGKLHSTFLITSGNIVFSDIRHINEAEYVVEHGGTLIKLFRNTGLVDNHSSETELDNIVCDFNVDNDVVFTIDYLYEQIDNIYNIIVDS